MHQENIDLEILIEDEVLDDHFEHERIPHDNYGSKLFDEGYQIDPGLFEPNQAIERFHEIHDQSNFNEPAFTELEPDLEIIRVLPTNQPKILKYLDPK